MYFQEYVIIKILSLNDSKEEEKKKVTKYDTDK